MSIRISEKDILFAAINVVTVLAYISYISLDSVAYIAQLMAGNDPQYVKIELAIGMIRMFAYVPIVIAGLLTLLADMWWGVRVVRKQRKDYDRENL